MTAEVIGQAFVDILARTSEFPDTLKRGLATGDATATAAGKSLGKALDSGVGESGKKTGERVSDDVGKTMKGRFDGLGALIGGAIGGGVVVAGDKLKEFAQGSVDAFAAVEDATGAAGVQFGKTLPQVLNFADQAFKNFGLSKRAALDAQNTFGTLGKAAGLTDKPLADFSGKLTGLAGDLASFKGTSTEQAIEAVGAALRGESEPIRAYGVLLNDASIQAEGLALGLAKPVVNADKLAAAHLRVKIATEALAAAQKAHGASSIEVEKAQGALSAAQSAVTKAAEGSIPPLSAANKTLAIQSLIVKQTKDAHGDFVRTADSTANTQKRLEAATENASAALGQRLAPVMTAARTVLLGLILSLTGAFDVLAKLKPGIDAVTGALSGTIGFIERNRALFATLTIAVLALTGPYLAQVIAIQAQVAAFIVQQTVLNGVAAVTRTYTAVQAALNVVLTANPIGLVVIAIAGLVAGLILAYKHSETFRTIVKGAFDAVADAVGFVVDKLGDAFGLLGHVPGFGWAKTAAASLHGAADAARDLGEKVKGIPEYKHIKVDLAVNGINTLAGVTAKLDRLDGARAAGGPVRAGGAYLVGENGPELLVPAFDGTIVPNDRLDTGHGRTVGSAGRSVTIENLNVTAPVNSPYAIARATELALQMAL